MTCTSTSAPTAHVFDPSDWLAKFESVGGGYILTDTLSLAILIEDRSDEDITRARRMIRHLAPQDRARLVALLRGRRNGREG